MKPIFLEFCGINSFSERAEVDFTALLEYGIFGIFGDTGSGKSTILDAISFALYGNVLRTRTGSKADIINFRSDKAYSFFEFEITFEGKRHAYRIEREIKRKNASQSTRVYERTQEGYLAVADGTKECNALIQRIIGLEQHDFEKCIALPQGEFAQFVKSAPADRVKLISRLFNLEEYGESLTAKINARHSGAKSNLQNVQTRLEPYSEVTEGAIKEKKAQLKSSEEQIQTQRRLLEEARREEKRRTSLWSEREKRDKLLQRLSCLDGEKSEIDALSNDLSRLESAEALVKAEEEYVRTQRTESALAEKVKFAQAEKISAEEAERNAIARRDAEGAEEQLSQLTVRVEQARLREANREKLEKLFNDLKRARGEYAEEAKQFQGFDYEAQKSALEAQKAELGGDFLSMLSEEERRSLFAQEYREFIAILQELTIKYPQIAGDTATAIKTFQSRVSESSIDFATLQKTYAEREARRKAMDGQLLDLEKKYGLYRSHLDRLQALQTEGTRIKAEYDQLKAQTGEGETLLEAQRALNAYKKERTAIVGECTQLASRRERAVGAYQQVSTEYAKAQAEYSVAQRAREEALQKSGHASVAEAKSLVQKFGDAEHAKARVEAFRKEYEEISSQLKAFDQTAMSGITQEDVATAQESVRQLEKAVEELSNAIALLQSEMTSLQERLQTKKQLKKQLEEVERETAIYERLKSLVSGNKFMEFVAEEYLVNVSTRASERLLVLTDGRYFLKYDGAFCVGDNFNGGNLRAVYTLSGGETFLVSLSLALSLSAEICAKSLRPIEFFFLDEGFGTLDGRLVDTVMDSLEKLKGEHFSIGIISHVEEMKHRIAKKLLVEKASERRGSQIHAE